MRVTVYSKPGCEPCEDLLQILDRLTSQYGLEVHEINILESTSVYEAYKDIIPVVEVGGGKIGRLVAPIDEPELRFYLELARRLIPVAPMAPVVPVVSVGVVADAQREPLMDRMAAYIGNHWLRLVGVVLAIFVGLPWLAPVFAALGWWNLADPIYTAYAVT